MPRKSPVFAIGLVILVSSFYFLSTRGSGHNEVLTGSNPPLNPAAFSSQAYLPFISGNGLPTPTITPTPTATTAPNSFLETFDGNPINPQPWQPAHWDVTVHTRSSANQDTLSPMRADHGAQCEPPPATHPINTVAPNGRICLRIFCKWLAPTLSHVTKKICGCNAHACGDRVGCRRYGHLLAVSAGDFR